MILIEPGRRGGDMPLLRRIIFLVFSLALFCSSVSASFDNAFKLYEKGKLSEAFYAFKNLAYIGDKSSQFNLGVMYYRGEHVASDPVEAYSWMMVASEDGDESFLKTKKIIFDKLNEKEKLAARDRAILYLNKYGREVLSQALAPKPLSDEECEQDRILIGEVKPKYPRSAEMQGLLGYVDLLFNVSGEGYARDISVRTMTDAQFFKASARALSEGRWEKKIENNKSILSRGVMFRFTFAGFEDMKLKTKRFEKEAKEKLEKAEEGNLQSQYEYAKTLEAARILRLDIDGLDVEYQASNDWYLKSAQQGHPYAQYELGKNMLTGKGCEVDRQSGLKWLRAAAIAGDPYAQEEIAMSTIGDVNSDVERAILWLRKASEEDVYSPKLFLAWELATNPIKTLRDGDEALRLLKAKSKFYYDDVRIFETKAAAYAQVGDFKSAIKWQKKALKKAKRLDWKIAVMDKRLAAYEKGISWQGPYHVTEKV